jgi:glycosyltransferase involved in cell wall biosynthesis
VRQPIFLLIYHVHRDVFTEHLPLPLALLARTIEEVLMPLMYRGRQILTISESSKSEIIKLGISHPSQITIIHPGIDLPPRKKYKKTVQPSLCYVGRLKAYKNVDVLLKAFKQVQDILPSATLTIAGSGEVESELKKLALSLGIDAAVTFKGKISEADKASVYATSWLAVQPSMIEGWGITVIEANAVGTPVVASKVKGLRDSVVEKETGLLVKSGDVTGFADAMLSLLKNKKMLSRYSLAAKNWSQRFSWDQAAEEMEQVLASHAHEKIAQHSPEYAIQKEK